MCQYSATDGVVGSWHLVHLGALATGGAGLIIAEATAVSPKGRISIGCPGLWGNEHIDAWRAVTTLVHELGAHIGVQLAHAGRKGSTMRPWDDHTTASVAEGGWETVAPSPLAFPGYPMPRAMTTSDIEDVINDFVRAGHNAISAGFDVVEIHAAHGYLLHEFLSPLSNNRTDEYGGGFEGRTRLLLEVVRALRMALPKTPLMVRISATDWTEGGWTLDESIALGIRLQGEGVDAIDVSSGGNAANATIPVGPGYQVPLATALADSLHIPVTAVGLITEPDQAEAIVRDTSVSAVLIARVALRNPRWPLMAAEALGGAVQWPRQFERARPAPPRTN